MKKANKIAISLALTLYVLGGVVAAKGLIWNVPAVNWKGATYFGATWVLWTKFSPVELPIPGWAFTFEGEND